MGPQHEQMIPGEKPTESERRQIVQLMKQVSYRDIQFLKIRRCWWDGGETDSFQIVKETLKWHIPLQSK